MKELAINTKTKKRNKINTCAWIKNKKQHLGCVYWTRIELFISGGRSSQVISSSHPYINTWLPFILYFSIFDCGFYFWYDLLFSQLLLYGFFPCILVFFKFKIKISVQINIIILTCNILLMSQLGCTAESRQFKCEMFHCCPWKCLFPAVSVSCKTDRK